MSNGYENLIPIKSRSSEEARGLGRIGGIKSGQVRREKKLASQALKEMILDGKEEVELKNPETGETKKLRISPELFNRGMIKKALQGNTRAWELIMGYLEGLPTQRIEQDITQKVEKIEVKIITNETGEVYVRRRCRLFAKLIGV